LVVEQAKPAAEIGTFIHPELHGQPKTASLAFKRRGGSTVFGGPKDSVATPPTRQAFEVPDHRKSPR